MKCLYLVLALIAIFSTVSADLNVYKKDFDKTGKAYYFNPSKEYKGKKITVGEDCTKVVVYLKDANGQLSSPSETEKLSTYQGEYHAEIIRYPGGKCTLPDEQRYDKEVIDTKPEDLVNFYNGKKGPLKYTFKTENNSETSGFFKNKWVIIGIIAVAIVLIGGIVGAVFISRRKDEDDEDYNKRFTSNDKDMKQISEPYIGLSNEKDIYKIGQPFNTNKSIPAPANSYNWNVPDSPKSSDSGSSNNNNNGLAPPAEPKRINSLTYEEQQSFTDILNKAFGDESNTYGSKGIPDEYEKYKTFKVVRKFTPQRNDELVVENGHLVKMIKSFEDGWTLCYNIDTKKEGYIPKNKLAPVDQIQKPQTIMHTDTVSTTSSTKPLLHNTSTASSYSSNSTYNRNNRGQRGVNTRNNSGNSRSQPNKYYRRPSNDNYVNSGFQRSPSQNQRYD